MKLHRITGTAAASTGALLLVLTGSSTASARPTPARSAAAAEQLVNVMLQPLTIAFAPKRVESGQTTLVVHNHCAAATAFLIARQSGGLNSLPRFYGKSFVPREDLVGRITQLNADGQKRLRIMLGRGNYLLLTSTSVQGGNGPIFVNAATPIAVQ